MKKNLRLLVGAALGAAASLAFTSCAYDPYYASTTVGGSYSSGGYGGSSTSLFVSTGDSRWGYDPYTYSYYDYSRRSYYDPYLNGYYPVGYRPAVVYGVPHPYGWSPGSRYCPPPRYVRNVTVVNYRNRESAYRSSNYGWAKQVRSAPSGGGRIQGERPRVQIPNRSAESGYRSSARPSQIVSRREEPSRYGSGQTYSRPQERSVSRPIPQTRSEPTQKRYSASTGGGRSIQQESARRPQLGIPGGSRSSGSSSRGGDRRESTRGGDDGRIKGYR